MSAWEEKIIERQKAVEEATETASKKIAKGLKADGIPVDIILTN